MTEKKQDIHDAVRTGYARIAKGQSESSCCGPTACCGGSQENEATRLAQAIGYEMNDLAYLPQGANLGLSCGNPVALASLSEGDRVLDLGSGGGFDVFIAGRKVGPEGRVIGVDMTPEMLGKARRNVAEYKKQSGLDNVEFRLGEIEHLPVADASMDVVISNCVINLSPDKPQVWQEMARVLKPGGRVSVSDIALLKPLPEEALASVEALVGCVAGAVLVEETGKMMRDAGLVDIKLHRHSEAITAMVSSNDAIYQETLGSLPEGSSAEDYITSLYATARMA